jgi:hypothetical protein
MGCDFKTWNNIMKKFADPLNNEPRTTEAFRKEAKEKIWDEFNLLVWEILGYLLSRRISI